MEKGALISTVRAQRPSTCWIDLRHHVTIVIIFGCMNRLKHTIELHERFVANEGDQQPPSRSAPRIARRSNIISVAQSATPDGSEWI